MTREYTYTCIERPRWITKDYKDTPAKRPVRDPNDTSPRKPWDVEDWGDESLRWNGVYRPGEAIAAQSKVKTLTGSAAEKAGVAKAGRLCAGNVIADSEEEAKQKIVEMHGDNCELAEFTARTVILTL